MKYWAFLSYSHTDAKWGDWLHKALETYRVPPRLIGKESRDGKIPERVFPIFRDREELPVSADLGSNISEALEQSRYLIVVCSPRSAQSRWVGEEIKTFKKLGREDRILALIVDGEPNASDGKPGFKIEDECFHELMRHRLAADGTVTAQRTEPIAADSREGKDGKANAKLKLLAGLLGVNYDDLRQREQERRLRRTRRILAIAIVLIGVFAALAVAFFFKEREATRARDEARRTLSQSDFLQALRSVDEDRDLDALAQLARSLRSDPSNQSAAFRLATLLSYREYPTLVLRLKLDTEVWSAQFSPNGDLILTVTEKEARVWDAQTGHPVSKSIKSDAIVRSARFSPDGTRVVTGAADFTARIWDARTGTLLVEPMKHDNYVSSVEFSPDGKKILTASPGKEARSRAEARIWDAETGKALLGPIEFGDRRMLAEAHFSPDGRRIVTVADDARIWDAVNGKPLTQPMQAEWSAQFSPDGKRLATGVDSFALIWDAQTARRIGPELNVGGQNVSVEFSPDGTRIIASGCFRDVGCTTQLWYAHLLNARFKLEEFRAAGGSAEFSPNGKRFLTISNVANVTSGSGFVTFAPRVRIWNAGWIRIDPSGSGGWDNEAAKPRTEPITYSDPVSSAHFSPDGRWIITTAGREVQVYDLSSRRQRSERLPQEGEIPFADFTSDSKRIITVRSNFQTDTSTLQFWDAETCKPVGNLIRRQGAHVYVSRDKTQAFVVSENKTGRLYDLEGRAVGKEISFTDVPASVEFSRAHTRILVAVTNYAQIISAVDGASLGPKMSQEELRSAQFSANESFVATYSADEARIWDAQSGKPLTDLIKVEGVNRSPVFSPDSRCFATVRENSLQIWDIRTGKAMRTVSDPGLFAARAEYSPDGRRIFTSGKYQSRVWNSETLTPVTEAMDAVVGGGGFSPDGKLLLGSSNIWDAETGKRLAEFGGTLFSPDGRRLLDFSTPGLENQGRVVDLMPKRKSAPVWLSRLADAIAGQHLNDQGVLEPLKEDQSRALAEIKEKLDREPADDDWAIWGRWFLADRSTRTISPFSKITVPEYIENRIKENTPESLDEAEELAIGNPELLQRIKKTRESLSAR